MREPPAGQAAEAAEAADVAAGPASADTWDAEGDLAPGARVDQWVIEKKLGAGGFGTVYEGRQPVIGKRVAIKVLARRFSVDPKAVARFVSEARIVNRIGHASIVDIFAFGTLDDGRHYHVMELCEGETLEALLVRRGRLPLAEALPLMRGIASALDAAHDQGGVHRDLKPENVIVTMVDGVATPKVIDFGIAKLLGEHETTGVTESGAVIGTPRYMSPEQCRGRDVDARSDVYSFGVLAYEMLTGEVPFSGEDSLEVMLKHTSEPARPPSELVSELPPSVDSILLSMLAKDREDRPERLVEVVARLERGEAPSRRAPRHPRAAGASGARARWWAFGAAGLAGIVALAWASTRDDSAEARPEPAKPEPAAARERDVAPRSVHGAPAAISIPRPSTVEPAASARAAPSAASAAPRRSRTTASSTAPPRPSAHRATGPGDPRLDDVEDPFRR